MLNPDSFKIPGIRLIRFITSNASRLTIRNAESTSAYFCFSRRRLAINNNRLNERIRLAEDGSNRFGNLVALAVHRHENTNDTVSARSAPGNKTASPRKSKPGLEKNQKSR